MAEVTLKQLRKHLEITNVPTNVPTREDLEALINWLALPYAGEPVWHMESETRSPHKERLQATWRAVVTDPKGPPGEGTWKPCEQCWGVGWLVWREGDPVYKEEGL